MSNDIVKKIPAGRWIHIIPPTILVYIVAFMDRTNIGFAIAGGMDKTLGITSTIAGLAAGIFFIGYMFLQVPGGRIAETGSAKKFITWTIVAWGILAMLSGCVQNITQLLIIRFLLGVAEGGVYPAILTIISHWFPNGERGRANSFFIMNIPIASIITGPLSGWIISAYSWRYVFIIEGAVAFLLMFIWLPLISDRPSDAKWISKEEKDYIESTLREEQIALGGKKVVKHSIGTVLSNKNIWKLIAIYFCFNTGVYGFALWLPTILKTLTHSGMSGVGMLSTIPYIGTIIGLYVFATLSDRSMNRKLYTAIPLFGFALCLFLSVVFKSSIWVSFAFITGCGVFFQATSGVFWTMPPILFDGDMAASSRGIINALGNLGGFAGPFLVGLLTTHFGAGIGTMSLVAFLFLAFLITLTLPAKTGAMNAIANKQAKVVEN